MDDTEVITERRHTEDRRAPETVQVDPSAMRRVVCAAIRWPVIGGFVALLALAALIFLALHGVSAQVQDLDAGLAKQREIAQATENRLETLAGERERKAAADRIRYNELANKVSYALDAVGDFKNATEKLHARLNEITERMDRNAAATNREADARRDLIRTMEAFGQRLQRQ